MNIAIIAKMRNGPMVAYRQRFGLSQAAAARLAGIGHQAWNSLECLRFGKWRVRLETIEAVASLIDSTVDELFPEELRGHDLSASRTMFRQMEAARLTARPLAALPAPPEPEAEAKYVVERMLATAGLTEREDRIVRLRNGLNGVPAMTYKAIGEQFGLCCERVRQIEARAIRKMQHPDVCEAVA